MTNFSEIKSIYTSLSCRPFSFDRQRSDPKRHIIGPMWAQRFIPIEWIAVWADSKLGIRINQRIGNFKHDVYGLVLDASIVLTSQ